MSKINKKINRVKPTRQEATTGDPVMDAFLDDMAMFYNTGKRHRGADRAMYERSEFVALHPELEDERVVRSFSSSKIHETFILALYYAYCRGYNGEEL